jgi:hypothetical protein
MIITATTAAITLLSIGFTGLLGYVTAKWVFAKDTEIENRRRAAAKLASKLSEMGLVKTPEFLIDYSVGDYSGMANRIKRLAELFLSGEAHVVAELENVFSRVLSAKLLTEAGRTLIAAKLADASKTTDPSVTTATKVAIA